jgi:hypothetical protein
MTKKILFIILLNVSFLNLFPQDIIYESKEDSTIGVMVDAEFKKRQDSINEQEVAFNQPKILGTNIPNNCDTIDYNIDHITVYFDRQMQIGNNGISPGKYTFPVDHIRKAQWNNDTTGWTIFVKLEPDTRYSIIYHNFIFISSEGYIPKETYTLEFKTKKQQ